MSRRSSVPCVWLAGCWHSWRPWLSSSTSTASGYPQACGPDCIDANIQESYQDGRGGGRIGGYAYSALVINLSELGRLRGCADGADHCCHADNALQRRRAGHGGHRLEPQSAHPAQPAGGTGAGAARMQAGQALGMAQEGSHVRISKPQPAQLTAAPTAGPALPAPRSDWMPIPNRLRSLFRRPAKAEALPIEESEPASGVGVMKRMLAWRRQDSHAETSADGDGGSSNRLERFLNLGESLPAASPDAPSAVPRPSQTRNRIQPGRSARRPIAASKPRHRHSAAKAERPPQASRAA